MKNKFNGLLAELITKAERGNVHDIDFIMSFLTAESSLAETRFVDFALSLVETQEGFDRVTHYLFHGSLIQRNYASLYLNRLGERKSVKLAYEQGLIDEVQAFAR